MRGRLDHLENLLDSLVLRMEEKNEAEDKAGSRLFQTLMEKENQDLKRRVLQLEEKLQNSNVQMDNVKITVSKLLSTNQQLMARISVLENNNEMSKKKDINITFGRSIKNSYKSNEFVNKTHKSSKEKRLLTDVSTPTPPFAVGIAFSAYVSRFETDIAKDYTIKFDSIVTNVGNHYNPYSGIFIAPQHGVYVFTWNLYGGYICSEMIVNSNPVAAMLSEGKGASNVRSTTGVVVVKINHGDVVFVRTHPTENHIGNLFSYSSWRSSFNGWKIN
ncbi:uncharacterized protein LOC134235282 [Saccostrea cucullata]|uniref:uncharacterized protein LOC134235282 n=1 Tax=Saccostrea cuccullata TaxID=36930 RepID=UPI002ED009A0